MGKTNNNHAKANPVKNKNQNHTNNNQEQTYDLKSHTIQELYDIAEGFYDQLKGNNQNDKWNEFISQKGTKKDKITFVAAEIIKKP